MGVSGIDHINIHTACIADTIEFYTSVLGLEHRPKPSGSQRGAWLFLGEVAIVHLNEVDEPLAGMSSPVNHVAFAIADVDEMRHTLDAADVPYEASVRNDLGITQLFVTDPNGIALELQARH